MVPTSWLVSSTITSFLFAPVSLLFESKAQSCKDSVAVGGDSEYRELQQQFLGAEKHRACSPVNQVVSKRGRAGRGGRQEPRSLSHMPTPSLTGVTGSPDKEDSCPVPGQIEKQLWQPGLEVCVLLPRMESSWKYVDSLIRTPVSSRSPLTPGFLFCFLKKNVLQGQHEADKIWSKEGFYAVIIFLSIFVIIVTCLMVSLLLCVSYPLRIQLLSNRRYFPTWMNVKKTGGGGGGGASL